MAYYDLPLEQLKAYLPDRSEPGDFDALTARIARSGITVSTVALGQEPSGPLLEGMAEIGHGHFYRRQTAAEVPAVFALETARATRVGIHEQPVLARAAAGRLLPGALRDGRFPGVRTGVAGSRANQIDCALRLHRWIL